MFQILKVSLVPISMFIWQTNSGGSHGWILDVIYNKEMIRPMITSHPVKCDHLKDMVKDNQILVTSFVDDIPCTFLHSSQGSKNELGRGSSQDDHFCSKDS